MLDVGGTHVAAAVVDTGDWRLTGARTRLPLDALAGADVIVATFARAAAAIDAPGEATWAVAMPGPFDYARGVGRFTGVGKFEALRGVDVRAALAAALPRRPRAVRFLNDADAFTLGEYAHGAATECRRVLGITLGTGIGSGWVVDGQVVSSGPGVPPGGRAHRLVVDGVPLEDRVSRRAIRAAYGVADDPTGQVDVRDIARRARDGEPRAGHVLRAAMRTLGGVLAPAAREFRADVVVVGGSMSASWDLLGPWFAETFTAGIPVRLAADPEHAALFGAARFLTG